MQKKILIIVIGLVFLSAAVNAQKCYIEQICGTDVAVFSVSFHINAHAAVDPEYVDYGWKVCCQEPFTGNKCGISGPDSVALRLYSSVNSHVEVPEAGNYGFDVCLSADDEVYCWSTTEMCDYDEGEVGVVSISDWSNAQVAYYGYILYPINICCSTEAPPLDVWDVDVQTLNAGLPATTFNVDDALDILVTITNKSGDNKRASLTVRLVDAITGDDVAGVSPITSNERVPVAGDSTVTSPLPSVPLSTVGKGAFTVIASVEKWDGPPEEEIIRNNYASKDIVVMQVATAMADEMPIIFVPFIALVVLILIYNKKIK